MEVNLPPGWRTSMVLSGLLALVLPPLVGVVLVRRWKLRWRVLLTGALVFTATQLLTRIPLVAALGQILRPALRSSPTLEWLWLVVLSSSAGLFEESGRLAAFRWLLRSEPRSARIATVFGIGHGGLEAMVLVGLSQIANGLLVPEAFARLDPTALPAEVLEQVAEQVRMLEAQTAWTPFLALWERAAAIVLHVALTWIVVSGLRDGRIWRRWGLAVALHTLVNLAGAGYLKIAGSARPAALLTSELVVSAGAAFALWCAVSVWRAPSRRSV
ncbi:MAG: YhfC family intramembrane metalloprotease [Deltaproteobacteria bacterium]|nr:MAG: YhfC family intramembrane metalloprotease [Deltaproteobacteria bacterium]